MLGFWQCSRQMSKPTPTITRTKAQWIGSSGGHALTKVDFKTFLPAAYKDDGEGQVVGMAPEQLLFEIIRDSEHQQRNREKMVRQPLLDKAAAAKAQDMAARDYFAHTSPAGVSANQNVRNSGYPLPDWYVQNGNNVESLSIGGNTLEQIANGWYKSDKHRPHVYAEDKFFAVQLCIGIGKATAKDGRVLFVFISCPCP